MTEEMQEILKKYINVINRSTFPSNIDEDDISPNIDIEEKIFKINEIIIQREESQKISLRNQLTKTVTIFIWIQLIFFNIIVLFIVLSVTSTLPWLREIDNELANLLFDFLKYYISATIVELLGMLVFILHYVFSKFHRLNKLNNIFKE